jgi:DNA-binding MarR family transcriptional regulator
MGIGYQLRRTFMALHRRLKNAIAPLGVTPDQYVVLWVLNSYGKLSQREIYELIYSDGNTVGEMLHRMEKKGWVRRVRHPGDGRARQVEITSPGQDLRRRIFSIARQFHREAFRGIGHREKRKLTETLTRLFQSLERNGRSG